LDSLREELELKRSGLDVLRDELAYSGRELASETETNRQPRVRGVPFMEAYPPLAEGLAGRDSLG
jgi:hypothetical protein